MYVSTEKSNRFLIDLQRGLKIKTIKKEIKKKFTFLLFSKFNFQLISSLSILKLFSFFYIMIYFLDCFYNS
jgi:hypothetical protein